jgi:hypothetical protein
MNSLPIESADWLASFKNRVALERSVLGTLIHWGFTESASDIHRMLEERFGDALTSPFCPNDSHAFCVSREDRREIAQNLRDTYLKVRDLPRRRICQERLHNELLMGFNELTRQLVQCYKDYFQRSGEFKASPRAA